MADKAHILQLAWAAGVFDAKGIIPKSGSTLRIEAVDEDMMKRLHKTLGVGQLKQRKKKDVARLIWTFQTTSMDDTRTLLLDLAPFLSATKVRQCAEIVARIERSAVWQQKNPEKVSSSVIYPAQNAEAETTQASTQADGHTVTQ